MKLITRERFGWAAPLLALGLSAWAIQGCAAHRREKEAQAEQASANLKRHAFNFAAKMQLGSYECDDGTCFIDCSALLNGQPVTFECFDDGCRWERQRRQGGFMVKVPGGYVY